MKVKVYTIELGQPRTFAKILLWVGVPVFVLLGIVAAVWAASFVSGESLKADKMNSLIVPSGAVVGFSLQSCPTGWTAYPGLVGRVPIGATGAAVGAQGGSSSVTLTAPNLPPHSHYVPGGPYVLIGLPPSAPDGLHSISGPNGYYGATLILDAPTSSNDKSNTMASKQIDITPANVGLLYCKKD